MGGSHFYAKLTTNSASGIPKLLVCFFSSSPLVVMMETSLDYDHNQLNNHKIRTDFDTKPKAHSTFATHKHVLLVSDANIVRWRSVGEANEF